MTGIGHTGEKDDDYLYASSSADLTIAVRKLRRAVVITKFTMEKSFCISMDFLPEKNILLAGDIEGRISLLDLANSKI